MTEGRVSNLVQRGNPVGVSISSVFSWVVIFSSASDFCPPSGVLHVRPMLEFHVSQTRLTDPEAPGDSNPRHDMKEPFFNKRKTLMALGPDLRKEVFAKIEREANVRLDIPQDADVPKVLEALASDAAVKHNSLLQCFNVFQATGRRTGRPIAYVLEENRVKEPERFPDWSPIEKAAWCFLHLPSGKWQELCALVRLRRYTLRDWLKVRVTKAPKREPDNSEEDLNQLRDAVCAAVSREESRGRYGDVSHIEERDCRSRKSYYILRMNDHVVEKPVWIEANRFDDRTSRDAFQIVFMFDWNRNEIHIRYDGGDAAYRQFLCEVWAKTMLGEGAMVERKKDSYDIQQFKDPVYGKNLLLDTDSSIRRAEVVFLKLLREGNKQRSRTYRESTGLYDTLESELAEGMGQVRDDEVSNVTIRLFVDPGDGDDLIALQLNLSKTSSNYQSFDADFIPDVEDFLRDNRIICDDGEEERKHSGKEQIDA